MEAGRESGVRRKGHGEKRRELPPKVGGFFVFCFFVLTWGRWGDQWNAHDLLWASCSGKQTSCKHNVLFVVFLTGRMKRVLSHSIAEQCSIIKMKLDLNYYEIPFTQSICIYGKTIWTTGYNFQRDYYVISRSLSDSGMVNAEKTMTTWILGHRPMIWNEIPFFIYWTPAMWSALNTNLHTIRE